MRATPSSSTAQRSGSEPGPAHLLSGGRSRAALSIALSSALVAFAAGCGGDRSDPPTDPGNQTTHSPQLKFFVGDDACAQLESHIETSVETTLRKQFEGWRRSRSDAASGVAAPVESPAPSAPPPASAAPAAESFSSTTVRSAGVDEPDPVKNDGRRVFTLKRTSDAVVLSRVDLGAAGAMTLGSQVRWPSPASEGADPFESPSGLYLLDEARVVALTTSGAHWGPWTDGPWMPVPAATAVPQIAAKTSLCQGDVATPMPRHLRCTCDWWTPRPPDCRRAGRSASTVHWSAAAVSATRSISSPARNCSSPMASSAGRPSIGPSTTGNGMPTSIARSRTTPG